MAAMKMTLLHWYEIYRRDNNYEIFQKKYLISNT